MKAKELLAEATKKLESHKQALVLPVAMTPRVELAKPLLVEEGSKAETRERATKSAPPPIEKSQQGNVRKPNGKEGPTQKKGITLRPSNLKKLDDLELALRKQGVKANHSGLIQLAIEQLRNGPELVEAYREHLKQDLRFR